MKIARMSARTYGYGMAAEEIESEVVYETCPWHTRNALCLASMGLLLPRAHAFAAVHVNTEWRRIDQHARAVQIVVL
jgi:hypothetical protein